MPSSIGLFKKYLNNIFVETGTWNGEGIDNAIAAGFNKIYSIELSEKHYNLCKNKYKNNPNVNLYHGESFVVLKEIMPKIDEPATFWLDAHYSQGDTALGRYRCPLMQELEVLRDFAQIHQNTILIDDIRLCGTEEFGDVSKDKIISMLMEINPYYKVSYDTGILRFPKDILVSRIE